MGFSLKVFWGGKTYDLCTNLRKSNVTFVTFVTFDTFLSFPDLGWPRWKHNNGRRHTKKVIKHFSALSLVTTKTFFLLQSAFFVKITSSGFPSVREILYLCSKNKTTRNMKKYSTHNTCFKHWSYDTSAHTDWHHLAIRNWGW